MNEELIDILQKSYEEQSSPLEGYRDKAQVDKLLYKDGYYLDGRIETDVYKRQAYKVPAQKQLLYHIFLSA